MYEDIVFQEGVDLGAIPEFTYRSDDITSIGNFDFRGLKGKIYGEASSPYTTVELFAPKEWFASVPNFGYRVDNVGPFRLKDNQEYYRLPKTGFYNDHLKYKAVSAETVKGMLYDSMSEVFKQYIPQIFEEKLKISPKGQEIQPTEKTKNRGLLVEELRKHKPVEIIKKGKLQYEDISKVGEYYYKLAELKDNELIPQYDKDREIIKEMLRDGLKESRIRLVFMNIEDRRNIPHQNHVAAILKEPTMKQYRAMVRQKTKTMQKQR